VISETLATFSSGLRLEEDPKTDIARQQGWAAQL
jgi:hypothetical protein